MAHILIVEDEAAIADTLSFMDDSVLLTVGIRHQRLKDEGYDYVSGAGGAISWNFNKFLVARDGAILAHYGSRTAPDDPELAAAIEKALAAAP